MQIRAVLFDYGMVLSGPADNDAYKNLISLSGLEQRTFDALYWSWRGPYDSGMFDGVGYWNKIAEATAITLDAGTVEQLIQQDVRMWSNINNEVVEWALHCKNSRLTTGVLSNICFELASSVEATFHWLTEFDHLFWSSRLGMAKPDPNLFRHVIDTLKIDPSQILFLDDREENVVAAQALGIQAIQFTTLDALQRQVKSSHLSFHLP